MKASTNGFNANFIVEGPPNAPWVTFSNSLVTSPEMWDAQARALAGNYRVLRYDTRGHGGSDAPPSPYTIPGLADDALAWWDKLGIESSHWVGLSLGGMIGINLAHRHPRRVRLLIASDCRADANVAYAGVFVECIRVTREQGMAAIVEPTIARFFTPPFAAAHPLVIETFRAMIRNTPAEGHVGCCEAIRHLSEGPNLATLAVPTLYIGGEHDIGAPPDMMRTMDEATPRSRHVVLKGAGHISNVEVPERFLAEIAPFLAAH
jgi:3-oxoadipate enol-lactonase